MSKSLGHFPVREDTLSMRIVKTLPVTGEFLFIWIYDEHVGSATMNTLNLTCALLLTLLSSITLFASFVKLFFTSDELNEMGVRLEPPEMQAE